MLSQLSVMFPFKEHLSRVTFYERRLKTCVGPARWMPPADSFLVSLLHRLNQSGMRSSWQAGGWWNHCWILTLLPGDKPAGGVDGEHITVFGKFGFVMCAVTAGTKPLLEWKEALWGDMWRSSRIWSPNHHSFISNQLYRYCIHFIC